MSFIQSIYSNMFSWRMKTSCPWAEGTRLLNSFQKILNLASEREIFYWLWEELKVSQCLSICLCGTILSQSLNLHHLSGADIIENFKQTSSQPKGKPWKIKLDGGSIRSSPSIGSILNKNMQFWSKAGHLLDTLGYWATPTWSWWTTSCPWSCCPPGN